MFNRKLISLLCYNTPIIQTLESLGLILYPTIKEIIDIFFKNKQMQMSPQNFFNICPVFIVGKYTIMCVYIYVGI